MIKTQKFDKGDFSKVVSGERNTKGIQALIADAIGLPVEEVFNV